MSGDSEKRPAGWRRWVWALVLGGAAIGLGWGLAVARRPIWPGAHWSWKAPEAAGFSFRGLSDFAQRAGGTGCLVHGGEMIYAWGDVSFRRDMASSIKPLYAYLVFKAIEAGRLASLDEPVLPWVPELGDLNAARGHKDRAITFRHLLTQTSGYGLAEKPGAAFAYNDYATGLLTWLTFYRVWDLPPVRYDELLNGETLGAVLGFEDAPTADYRGYRQAIRGRIRMSARDAARFALLYLRGGIWNGRRLLRRDLFAQALGGCLPADFPRTAGQDAELLPEEWKPIGAGGAKDLKNHLGCLGHFWWFNRPTPDGTRLLPDAPPGTFMGSGYGGRFAMVVIPEWDLVAVWQQVHPGEQWSPLSEVGRFKVNEMIRELRAARTVPAP